MSRKGCPRNEGAEFLVVYRARIAYLSAAVTIWIPGNLWRAGMVVAWLFLVVTEASAEKAFVFGETPGVLPKTIVPHNYRIWLKPDSEALTTKGTVEIEVDVREKSR